MKVKSSWRFILVSLLLLVGIGSTQGGVYDGWSYRMKIRVAGYNQAETLVNFPTLVILSTNIPGFLYTDFNSSANGADLRFAASNQTTELNYEIEKWNTNGDSYVWVQIPSVATTNDYIYAYWGNSASVPACTTNGSAWSENFAGVWHLDPSFGSPFRDASVNGNNGANGNSLDIAGAIANGRDFNQNDYVQVSDANSLDLSSAVTIEAWVKLDTYPTEWNVIVVKGDAANTRDYAIFIRNTGDILISCTTQNGGHHFYPTGQNFTLGVWHHIAGLIDTSINRMAVFIDGQQKGVDNSQSIGALIPNSEPLRFADVANAYPIDGKVDEVRVSNVARSTNWINTCWFNQVSNSAFLAFSDVGAQFTTLAVRANPVTGLGSTQATMGGRVLQTGSAENPYVYLCWGYTDGLTNATSAWAHVEALGANWGVGQSFSTNITGLLSGSNYSYRCYVTNSTGYDWSDAAVSFQTLSLPVVTNLGANAIGGQIATLRGQITATGGETPSTWFFYWLDGSATTTTVAKGTQSGVFITALSGLQIGSNYSYRCVASNGVGVVTSEDRNFQTLANEYIWNGAGSNNNASTPANWVQGVAPSQPSDLIRLDITSSKDMTWDLANTIAAWTQTADYHGTVTIGTTYGNTFPVMAIAGGCQVLGGTWTHSSNGATEDYRIRTSVGGDFTLGAAAAINLDVKGYGQGRGPGAGSAACANGVPGASHGGMGGEAINTTYGSITSPTNIGSGAWDPGGGAIWLSVGGTATINGSITARPTTSLGQGSAGSIFIQAGALAGSGSLDVSCPDNGWIQRGAGGGRIAVVLTSGASFGSVQMYAHGGRSQDATAGAAGTIYLQTSTKTDGTGTLLIDNAGISTLSQTLVTPAQSNLNTFSALIITNKSVLGLNANTAINLGSASLFCYGPSQSFIATPQTEGMQLPPTWQLQNCTLQVYTNLEVDGSLTITNASLEVFSSMATNVHIVANLIINSGGILSHGPNGASETYRLGLLVDGNLTIDAGGAIDVTSKGYGKGSGPGAGYGSNNNDLPGASHGGLSAENIPYNPWASWVTYGSILAPTNLGSGGILSGGGAIHATVNGTTRLDGSLLAKGYPSGMAGNAGGSIFLTTGSLEGSGLIDASANYTDQYGGGGGRIAVILKSGNSFDAVTMQAFGGGNSRRGAAGTIYRETLAQGAGRGVVTVNNGGVAAWTTDTVTPIPPSLSTPLLGLKFVALDVTNNANVSILTNITMGNLFLRDDSSKLRLNGNTLTLKAIYHADWGTTNRVVYDGGEIIWDPGQGTVFTIR